MTDQSSTPSSSPSIADYPAWLVQAKVRPPTLNRSDLKKIDAGFDLDRRKTVTFLEAPAGYGKTTWLMQCHQHWQTANHHAAAWLTIAEDDDSRSLGEYAGLAFLTQQLDVPADFFSAFSDNNEIKFCYRLLINAVERDPRKWLLVIDDLESASPDVLEQIGYLISIAPSNLKFCIAARHNPGLDLSRHRLTGQLEKYGFQNLCFTAKEIHTLFNGKISQAQANKIHEHTLGWPVAVSFFRCDLEEGMSLDDALTRNVNSTSDTHNYIASQVARRLKGKNLEILLQASVLDWVEPEAITGVLGPKAGFPDEPELKEIEPLIKAIDEGTNGFRLHPLLKEHLREIFKRDAPEKYRAIEANAAVWMARRGRLRHALTHVELSGNELLAGSILEDAGAMGLLIREGTDRAFQIRKHITPQVMERFPRIRLLRCAIEVKKGNLALARTLYQEGLDSTENYSRDREGGNNTLLETEHCICLSFLVHYACLPPKELSNSHIRSRLSLPTNNTLIDGAHANIFCWQEYATGNINAARKYASSAAIHYSNCSSLYGQMYIDILCGGIDHTVGRFSLAQEALDAAAKRQKQSFRNDSGAKLIIEVLQAECALSKGNWKPVEALIPNLARRLRTAEAWQDIYVVAISIATEFGMYTGQRDRAGILIDEFEQYVDEEGLESLRLYIAGLRTRLMTGGAASSPYSALNCTPAQIVCECASIPWRETEAKVLAYCACPESTDIEDLVGKVGQSLHTRNLVVPAVRILAAAIARSFKDSQLATCRSFLTQLLPMIQKTGFIWPIYLYRDSFSRIGADTSFADILHIGLIHDILEKIEAPTTPRFSKRELQVLRELEKELSDKEIARNLGVTEHAVRFHLKNIYAKIDVSSRFDAVEYIIAHQVLAGEQAQPEN